MLIVWQPPSVRLPNIVLKLIFFLQMLEHCARRRKREKNKPDSCLTGGSITSIVYLEVSP